MVSGDLNNMEMETSKSKYTKTERQLLLYEVLYTSQQVERQELMRRLGVSKKTIERDMRDLSDVGLLHIEYSRKDQAYIPTEGTNTIAESKETSHYRHLKKLERLTTFMQELSDAAVVYEPEYNCRNRYFELFPDVSERTRMRDYKTLARIGYTIYWDEYEKRHIVNGYLRQCREEF